MKNNSIQNNPGKFLLLAMAILLVFNACKKEVANLFNDKQLANANVQWAKTYYENNLAPKLKGFMSLQGRKQMNIKPGESERPKQVFLNWKTASAETQLDMDFVEVPLKSNFVSKTVFSTPSDGRIGNSADEKTLNAGFDRLMIIRNGDGSISERIVSYIPDRAYSDRHNGKITHNTITDLDKDFFGYIQYKDWDGKTDFVLRIENGVQVNRFSNMRPVSLPSMSKGANGQSLMLVDAGGGGGGGCLIITQSHTERWCYYDNWYDETPRYCDPWETVIDGEFLWCPGAPPQGGGGGGPVPTPDPEPEPDKPDPCKGAKKVSDNWMYNGEMSFLKGKLSVNKEMGYYKMLNQTSTQISGPENELELPIPDWNSMADGQLQYINHTHYTTTLALSTMDWDDFSAYCEYMGRNKVADKSAFTVGVTTSFGSYSFILSDQDKFNTFYANKFGPGSELSGTGANKQLWAQFFNPSTGITKDTNGLENEKRLIELIKDSGVSLLKQNSDGTWSAITKDSNGNIVKVHCATGGAVE